MSQCTKCDRCGAASVIKDAAHPIPPGWGRVNVLIRGEKQAEDTHWVMDLCSICATYAGDRILNQKDDQ